MELGYITGLGVGDSCVVSGEHKANYSSSFTKKEYRVHTAISSIDYFLNSVFSIRESPRNTSFQKY
jgi:hypothetical protein